MNRMRGTLLSLTIVELFFSTATWVGLAAGELDWLPAIWVGLRFVLVAFPESWKTVKRWKRRVYGTLWVAPQHCKHESWQIVLPADHVLRCTWEHDTVEDDRRLSLYSDALSCYTVMLHLSCWDWFVSNRFLVPCRRRRRLMNYCVSLASFLQKNEGRTNDSCYLVC